MQIDNLTQRLNDKGTLGLTTEIRLRQLQSKEWLYDNPLEIWGYNNINAFKGNLIAQILCLMNDLGLFISFMNTNKKIFNILPGGYPLINLFNDNYRNIKDSLRKKNLLYLEQLTYESGLSLKQWHELTQKFKGKIPYWWTTLKEEIKQINELENNKKDLQEQLSSNSLRKFSTNRRINVFTNIDGRHKNWILSLNTDNDNLIYGKIINGKKYFKENEQILIEHYWSAADNRGALKLMKCPVVGCNKGTIQNDCCLIEVKKKTSMLLKGRVIKIAPNKVKISHKKEDYEIVLNKIVRENQQLQEMVNQQQVCWVDLTNTWERTNTIKTILKDNLKCEELITIFTDNLTQKRSEYNFFTDGSMGKVKNDTKMGIGWVLVENTTNEVIHSFKSSNFGWPSSTKAEILSILTALLVVTSDSKVKIHTDSNNAITQFNKFRNEKSNRKKQKIANTGMWDNITDIINRFNIEVEWIKVKAHSNIWGNEEADILAKEGLASDTILLTNKGQSNPYKLA